MSLNSLQLLGPSEILDRKDLENLKLSIRMYSGGFSYVISQNNNILFLERKEFPNRICNYKEAAYFFKSTPIFTTIDEVRIITDSPFYHSIPKEILEHNSVEEIADIVQIDTQKYNLETYTANNLSLIYTCDKKWKDELFNGLFNHEIFTNSMIEILQKTQHNPTFKNNYAILNFSDNSAGYMLYMNHTLQIIRNFGLKYKTDFVYYLMHTFHNLNISPSSVKLFVTGLIEEESELIQLMSKYITPIFLSKNLPFENCTTSHYYIDLLNQ